MRTKQPKNKSAFLFFSFFIFLVFGLGVVSKSHNIYTNCSGIVVVARSRICNHLLLLLASKYPIETLISMVALRGMSSSDFLVKTLTRSMVNKLGDVVRYCDCCRDPKASPMDSDWEDTNELFKEPSHSDNNSLASRFALLILQVALMANLTF